MSGDPSRSVPTFKTPRRVIVIFALAVTQNFACVSSYYLPAVIGAPIATETGWSLTWVVSLSLGLLTAGVIFPLG